MILTEYTSGSLDGSGYNVTIVFEGANWTEELQAAFVASADYLSTLVTGDISDVTADFGDGQGVRTIDDLEIIATLDVIDGSGGILGQAGPQFYRAGDFLPITGQMTFDMADAQVLYDDDALNGTGVWSGTVLHEMLHVMGFGSMWDLMGLVTDVGTPGDPDFRFTGANAMYEYRSAFRGEYVNDPNAGAGVAVESDTGAPGTDGSHWSEAVFGDELMTGFVDGNPFLSNLTIAALQDMGYQTTYSASAPGCFTPGCQILTGWGELAVRDLRPGDLVWTLDEGLQPVVAVETARYDRLTLLAEERFRPIRLQPGSLGPGVPVRTMVLSPQHRVLVQGPLAARLCGSVQALVAVKDLVGLPGIARKRPRRGVRYIHLRLARHHLLMSDGAMTESRLPETAPLCRPEIKGADVRALVDRLAASGAAVQGKAGHSPALRTGRMVSSGRLT